MRRAVLGIEGDHALKSQLGFRIAVLIVVGGA